MTSMEDLKKYLDRTKEIFGIEGADVHLWIESSPKHKEMSFTECLKLRRKVEEHFGDIYGDYAWGIALTHFLMDFDTNKREVVTLTRQGDQLIPTIKTVKELQEETQRLRRERNEENISASK